MRPTPLLFSGPFVVSLTVVLAACGAKAPAATDTPAAATKDLVTLDSSQLSAAGVTVGAVSALPADTIYLTGTITFDAARVSHVGPRTPGRVRQVPVEIGSHVAAGDTLAVLDSPELGEAQSRWVRARFARELARRSLDRADRLFREGIVSERRRLEIEGEMRDRNAEFTSSLQALSALGAEPDSAGSGLFVLRAPLAGEVVEKHVNVGEIVGPGNSLFEVGELNQVWLMLDLYETDLSKVRVGSAARVVVDAYPDRRFEARVGLVSSVVDTVSRTIKVRVMILNPAHLLKPGMFARAGLALETPQRTVGMPHAAAQSIDGRDVAFVPDGRGRFRIRPVVLGPPRAGGWVEVRQGLAVGDSIVVRGSFALKSHLLRGTFGEVK
jgi:cobalt-zinc-cadmium efflux system membrane fusion protein